VGEIAAGFASAFSAQIDITWYAGPTALVNDERWADFATSVAREAGYETRHAELHMGGEDFAVYLQQIPGRLSASAATARLVYTIRHLIRMKH
jgi:metal-dependent amidase/aminoacylase/carboxypeptidase family protein